MVLITQLDYYTKYIVLSPKRAGHRIRNLDTVGKNEIYEQVTEFIKLSTYIFLEHVLFRLCRKRMLSSESCKTRFTAVIYFMIKASLYTDGGTISDRINCQTFWLHDLRIRCLEEAGGKYAYQLSRKVKYIYFSMYIYQFK